MTTTRDDLLRAVLAEPDDDAPRLVLADWLEDQGGEADLARAEFIRVQCELADPTAALRRFVGDGGDKRLIFLRRRERELWCAHAYDWMPCVGAPDQLIVKETCAEAKSFGDHAATIEYRSRRGFVEAVELDAAAWLQHADALLAAAPLREVRLTTMPFFYSCGAGYDDDYIVVVKAGGREHVLPAAGGYHPRTVLAALAAEWPGPNGRLRFVLPAP